MKPLAVILVHGFNVWDGGAGSVGKLKPYFEELGANTTMFKYGFVGLLLTRFFNEEIAEKLAVLINIKARTYKKVIVLGHSNGCAIAHLASYMCEGKVAKYVYINPALKKELVP